jgi:hypothetical protein
MPFGKNLKFTETTYGAAKNILASEKVKFVEGGATLAPATGTLAVGTGIARVTATGLWVKFVAGDVANYNDFGILNIDVVLDNTNNIVVGEVIVQGSVYESKLDASATVAAFKTAVGSNIRYVKHI